MSFPAPIPPSEPSGLHSRWFWGLSTLGILIRLRAYLAQRSLWLDEAMLALNIRNRDFIGLTQPLDMDQIAPVGFLWLEKCAVLAFGEAEWALRLVPLLCGIALLPVGYFALRRVAHVGIATGVLAVLAIHPQLVYFTQEVKPYGLDAFAVVLVLAIAVSVTRETSRRFPWMAVVAAALLPWFSLTSLFALPGLLLAMGVAARQQGSRRAIVDTVITGVVFGISCGLEYQLILRHQASNPLMQSYWAATFPNTTGGIAALSPWALQTGRALLQDPSMIPLLLVLPTALGLLLGAVYWAYHPSPVKWIIGGTIGMAILAALLRAYPPQGRLWLFAVPVLVITLAGGIEILWQRLPTSPTVAREGRILFTVVVLGLIFGKSTWITWQRTIDLDRGKREDVRGMCEFIRQHRHAGDALYVSRSSGPAVLWYFGRPEFLSVQEMPTTWGNAIDGQAPLAEAEIARCGTVARLWLLFSHTDRPADDPQSDAHLLRHALAEHTISVIQHRAAPNDFEHEPAWTELFLHQP